MDENTFGDSENGSIEINLVGVFNMPGFWLNKKETLKLKNKDVETTLSY